VRKSTKRPARTFVILTLKQVLAWRLTHTRRLALKNSFVEWQQIYALKSSDAVAGLRDYLYLRDKALEAAGIDNDSLAKVGALPQRQWLAGQAKKILQRNPEFYKFYYRFFKEELEG
jgi:hypothetical protein